MNASNWKSVAHHASRAGWSPAVAVPDEPLTVTVPVGAALNTVLAVREHAPAEILELSEEISALQHRLAAAYARKKLLERLLVVIRESDQEESAPPAGISVIR